MQTSHVTLGGETNKSTSGLVDCGIRQSRNPWGFVSGYHTEPNFGNDANSDDKSGKWN